MHTLDQIAEIQGFNKVYWFWKTPGTTGSFHMPKHNQTVYIKGKSDQKNTA